LTWISNNAVEGGAYTITLNANETIAPQTLYYSGKNVSIALNGGSAERTVSLSSTGSLFTVESGVTLTLGNNVTLQGRSGNTASLVNVNNDSALVMNAGSKITGNTTTSSYGGGGIYVFDSGAFTMEGGEISGNTSSFYGGGVYNNGTFEMSGGEITGNSSYSYYGGGVYNNGTFTMSGGEISGNTSSYGGGVYVGGGTFTMSNGEISGNTASSYGGGVSNGGTFEMSGGEISGNTTKGYGGGVYNSGTFELSGGEISDNTSSSSSSYSYGGGVYNSGTFTMSVGEISGNTASYYGGGVSNGGTFTMSGGEISGNTTNGYGGGVYISSGTFTKQGGTIYGSNASDSLKNIATSGDSYGHAVYVYSGGKIRNTTADSSVNLDNSGNTIGVTYSSVSGGTWTLLDDGRRQSPAITHSDITKSRVSFTSATTDTSIVIQLEVSSESGCDFAFISQLDNSYASYDSGYYSGSLISGESSVTVTIPVPTAGEHFIDIGYRKDGSVNAGSDCAWFKVTQAPHAGGWENGSIKISLQPTPTSPTLSNASLFVNESASFYAESDYASYAWYWNGELIGGEASYTYDLAANSRAPGIYELSVVVTNSAGKTLSARCRVIIRAN
jgi:hypothetical protein